MIKAVSFDLDHTLYDRYATLRLIAPLLKTHFELNSKLSDEQAAEIMIHADRYYVHKGWDALQEYLYKDTCLFAKMPQYDEYRKFVMGEFMNTAVSFPFTAPMLKSLKQSGFKLGLITNGNAKLQNRKIDLLKIRDYFDYIYIGGEHKFAKPHTEPFIITAEALSAAPCEMAYVGDNPQNDIEASRNAGCLPIHIDTTGTWVLEGIKRPKYSLPTVEKIPELISEINSGMV